MFFVRFIAAKYKYEIREHGTFPMTTMPTNDKITNARTLATTVNGWRDLILSTQPK